MIKKFIGIDITHSTSKQLKSFRNLLIDLGITDWRHCSTTVKDYIFLNPIDLFKIYKINSPIKHEDIFDPSSQVKYLELSLELGFIKPTTGRISCGELNYDSETNELNNIMLRLKPGNEDYSGYYLIVSSVTKESLEFRFESPNLNTIVTPDAIDSLCTRDKTILLNLLKDLVKFDILRDFSREEILINQLIFRFHEEETIPVFEN